MTSLFAKVRSYIKRQPRNVSSKHPPSLNMVTSVPSSFRMLQTQVMSQQCIPPSVRGMKPTSPTSRPRTACTGHDKIEPFSAMNLASGTFSEVLLYYVSTNQLIQPMTYVSTALQPCKLQCSKSSIESVTGSGLQNSSRDQYVNAFPQGEK